MNPRPGNVPGDWLAAKVERHPGRKWSDVPEFLNSHLNGTALRGHPPRLRRTAFPLREEAVRFVGKTVSYSREPPIPASAGKANGLSSKSFFPGLKRCKRAARELPRIMSDVRCPSGCGKLRDSPRGRTGRVP